MKEKTCENCKHWEWNIIGVNKDRRPAAGRCFCYIELGDGQKPYSYHYGYEKQNYCDWVGEK